jgi:hypothetical protein
MKADNRWLYVGGIAVLAVLVVVGLVWQGQQPAPRAADGGDAVSDARAGDSSPTDATPGVDGSAVPEAGADAAVAEPVPEDPAACRAYCARLADRGALAEGATTDSCVAALCASDGASPADSGAEQPQVPTVSEPVVPELPDDCRAQCDALEARHELREGMSLEDCYDALCSTGDGQADGGSATSDE